MKQLEWVLPQTPVTEEDLAAVSTILKQPFPDDFKGWLFRHNGATPEPSELSLEDGLTLIINCFISFSQSDDPNVVSILNMLGPRLPIGLLPIAEDHGGNYVCLRYLAETSTPDVVLWLHEEADPNCSIVEIASSFTNLIQRITQKK